MYILCLSRSSTCYVLLKWLYDELTGHSVQINRKYDCVVETTSVQQLLNVFIAVLQTLYTANPSLVVSTETIVSCHISQIITRTVRKRILSSTAHQVLQDGTFIREAKCLIPSCHRPFKTKRETKCETTCLKQMNTYCNLMNTYCRMESNIPRFHRQR